MSFDDLVFNMMGITVGELVDGIFLDGEYANTETIVISDLNGALRHIHTLHCLNSALVD